MLIRSLLSPLPACLLALVSLLAPAQVPAPPPAQTPPPPPSQTTQSEALPPADSVTDGTVHIAGQAVAYRAVAGTLTVGATDAQDATLNLEGQPMKDLGLPHVDPNKPEDAPPTARIFYAAYFKKAAPGEVRPVTFLYNGGPGSSTMWLHMGSFGPRRVVVPDAAHQEGAPYQLVENQYSVLDATDLVFIDAPGTGFSRIMGKDAGKAFWGTDGDAHAFARFIHRFLTKYNRWNSPKYLFGESYGTTRSAVLSNLLENETDLNGVMLLSQILNFNVTVDSSRDNPGTDIPYAVGLPSYAATAWYHHRVPNQTADLDALLKTVEEYALGDYAAALLQGSDLPLDRKQAIAAKLESFTGVPAALWVKADLRLTGGQFAHHLLGDQDQTTGRLDSRYQGPSMDPLGAESAYDPFTNAIASAYMAAINSYLRNDLKFGQQQTYLPSAYALPGFDWELRHVQPGQGGFPESAINVMPDLAAALKRNPKMKVMLMGGYFDLGTLFFGSVYEMKHLPMPASLEANISYHFFQTGHMVYVNEQGLHGLHDAVETFIHNSETGRP